MDFIKTVINTDIATLQDYLKFDHDERLENVDLYEMTMMVVFFRLHICRLYREIINFVPYRCVVCAIIER